MMRCSFNVEGLRHAAVTPRRPSSLDSGPQLVFDRLYRCTLMPDEG
jgi:hypothetical protein